MTDLARDIHVESMLACVPGVALRLDPDQDGGAWAYQVGGRPFVSVSADLAEAENRWPLYGALAHELSHHILGHVEDTPARRLLDGARKFALGALPMWAAFTAGRGNPHLAILLLLATVLVAWLGVQRERWMERAADVMSVPLLNAAGLPGTEVAEAALRNGPPETWWERATGWLWSSHPTAASRRRRIRSLT